MSSIADATRRAKEIHRTNFPEKEVRDDVTWEEDPVDFRTFCESPLYLNAFKLGGRQYEDAYRLLGSDPKRIFDPGRLEAILILVYGKGGGKDELAARITLYVVYVLLCMASPQEYLFGVKSTSSLDIINVARKGKQAQQVFFKYFRNHLLSSRWFSDRYDIEYKRQWHSRVKGAKKALGKIVVRNDGADFPKHITCISESTENESWEGYNVVFFILDEISGFKSVAELKTGWAIWKTARTSCTSRSTKTFRGMGIALSYPRQEEGDIILDLLKMSYDPANRDMVGSLAYPWESKGMSVFSGETFVFRHPRIEQFFGIEGAGIEIPIEYESDFRRDPGDSLTKYTCIPPKTSGAWLEYPELVYDLVSNQSDPSSPKYRKRLFITEDYVESIKNDVGEVIKYTVKRIAGCTAQTQHDRFSVQRVMWLDAAEKYCDAVLCIGHLEIRQVHTTEGIVPLEVVVQDDELVWRPDPVNAVKVSISNIDDVMLNQIPKYVKVVAAGADAWNSAELSEKLHRSGIRVLVHNINLDDYELTKRKIYGQGADILQSHTPAQLVNLINAGGNKKPIKKPGFLQDAADAFVGVVKLLAGTDGVKASSSSVRRHIQGLPTGVSVGATAGRGRVRSPHGAPSPSIMEGLPGLDSPMAGGEGMAGGVRHRPAPQDQLGALTPKGTPGGSGRSLPRPRKL